MKTHIFINGPLALEITQQIIKLQSDITYSAIDQTNFLPYIDQVELIYVISDNPCVKFCKKINDYCSEKNNISFIPIIVDQPFLTIGPIRLSKTDSCYHCYIERTMQHSPTPIVTERVWDFYEKNPNTYPLGHHPSEPSTIANLIVGHSMNEFESIKGKLFQLNLITREIIPSQVISVHGCKRCGLGRDEKTRGYEELQGLLFKVKEEPLNVD
jgi:hypothetical protein